VISPCSHLPITVARRGFRCASAKAPVDSEIERNRARVPLLPVGGQPPQGPRARSATCPPAPTRGRLRVLDSGQAKPGPSESVSQAHGRLRVFLARPGGQLEAPGLLGPSPRPSGQARAPLPPVTHRDRHAANRRPRSRRPWFETARGPRRRLRPARRPGPLTARWQHLVTVRCQPFGAILSALALSIREDVHGETATRRRPLAAASRARAPQRERLAQRPRRFSELLGTHWTD
jgi:hypothetical protein